VTLVLHGPDGTHRLPTAPGTLPVPSEDGRPWSGRFAWQEPPAAFVDAALQVGPDIVIALPEPGPEERAAPSDDAWRLQADLLSADQEAREARAAEGQLREELTRARADLDAEQARHAAAAERFREGLMQVQASAEHEIGVLRDRLAGLQRDSDDVRRLRADVERARSDAEGLLGRLTAMDRALGAAD
jgi:hypothetical protein